MRFAVLILCGIITSGISLRYFPAPYVWIFLLFFAVTMYEALSGKKTLVRLLCLNISLIAIVLCGFESYLWISEIRGNKERFEGDYTHGGYFIKPEDILGYVPVKDKAVNAIKYFEDQQIYEVTYTINADGLRISPPSTKNDNRECVLFFGGSFTFGEGLPDHEAMPYMVGLKSQGKYQIYNFAFHGYGPHQMLSAIEHNRVDSIIDCKPQYAIYQALVIHVDRSAGLSFWDEHGPRYVLDSNGTAQYSGHFDDMYNDNAIMKTTINQLNKSYIFKKYYNRQESVSKANIDLFIAIVNKAKRLLQESYPGLKFHVILWDVPDKNYDAIINLLDENNIKVHPIANILPNYPDGKFLYELHPPYDAHPNSLANSYISEYILSHIIGK